MNFEHCVRQDKICQCFSIFQHINDSEYFPLSFKSLNFKKGFVSITDLWAKFRDKIFGVKIERLFLTMMIMFFG